jgi:hypothetical protein
MMSLRGKDGVPTTQSLIVRDYVQELRVSRYGMREKREMLNITPGCAQGIFK